MSKFALAVLIVLGFAAPAHAATHWKRVPNLSGPPVAAGDGLVVARYGGHGVAAIGPKGVERTYDFGSLCGFTATAGAGKAVAHCSSGTDEWFAILDLSSGVITQLDPYGDGRLIGQYGLSITGIGAHWVEVPVAGNHYSVNEYWNPETGQVLEGPDATHFVDLNAEQPMVPLCSPVRRLKDPEEAFGGYDPLVGVTVAGSHAFFKRQVASTRLGLFSWRCGARNPVRVMSCGDPYACSFYTADARYLVWATRTGVVVMNFKTGKRAKLDGLPGKDPVSDIVLSDNHVYVARSYGRVHRTYVARLPA